MCDLDVLQSAQNKIEEVIEKAKVKSQNTILAGVSKGAFSSSYNMARTTDPHSTLIFTNTATIKSIPISSDSSTYTFLYFDQKKHSLTANTNIYTIARST